MPRAAVRPSVEKSASTGTLSLPSVMSNQFLHVGVPEAYETSSRASGPTSIGFSFQRGVFRNEYFSYPSSVSNGGFGPV